MSIISLYELSIAIGLSDVPTSGSTIETLANRAIAASIQAVKDFCRNDIEYAQHTEYYPTGTEGHGSRCFSDALMFDRGSSSRYSETSRFNSVIQLKNTPVYTNSLLVYEQADARYGQTQNSFGDSTLLTVGLDYYLDINAIISVPTYNPVDGSISNVSTPVSYTGHLYRNGSWPRESGSIKVTYFGGWRFQPLAALFNPGASPPSYATIKEAVLITATKAYREMSSLAKNESGPKTSENIGQYSYSIDSSLLQRMLGLQVTVPESAVQLLRQAGAVHGGGLFA
jgi:hypothetical protein